MNAVRSRLKALLAGLVERILSDRFAQIDTRVSAAEQIARQAQSNALAAADHVRDAVLDLRDRLPFGAFHPASRQRETGPVPPPQTIVPLEQYFGRLKEIDPEVFDVWKGLLDAAIAPYDEDARSNLSVEGNLSAKRFRGFCRPYLRGKVLDVGCGPQSVPIYLEDYRTEWVAAIDPIGTAADHPFQFVNGVAEFIPWEDATFDVIISGTTLDHAFSLDIVLEEINRVLAPGGVLLIWVGFIKGAKPVSLRERPIKPFDEYHLFHFDKGWFEEKLLGDYSLLEVIRINDNEYFYALKK